MPPQARRSPVALLLALLLAIPSVQTAHAAVTGPPAPAPRAGSAATASTTPASGVTSVMADGSSVTVSGSLPAADDTTGTSVDVYELDPTADTADYRQTTAVASVSAPLAGHAFRVSIPRFDGPRDRYYSKFLAVRRTSSGTTPVGVAHYVDDVRFTAANDYPFPQIADKKGLQVEMTDDAENLGVRHGAVNVVFDQMMLKDGTTGEQSIPYQVDGRTFYFSRSYVEGLDGQIKALSDNGTLVDLICILYGDGNPDSAFGELVHPDAAVGKGTVYAFNTKTPEGLEYFKAAMEFLTARYTRADQRYGRALGYIIGNEVNTAYVWQNMGDQTLPAFLEYYERALRIAWLAARKSYSHPRVYVSLDHEWNVAYDPAHPLESYKGKDVVDGLAALARQEGDFPWDIAYHPYPQNLFDPAFWKDTQATPDPSTALITFKNIQVLPAYLRRPELTYDGAPRRIILSEQGCNTPGDSLDAQKLQAACFAYAYYKIRFLDGIDAFILHRHVDHQAEGGLRLGLWTWDADRKDYALPGTPKYLYNVFKYIDTAKSLEVTKFALPIIGISDWRQVVPGFDPSALDQRSLPQQVGTSVGGTPVQEHVVAGFEDGTDGWGVSDNTDAVERTHTQPYAGRGALRVHFDSGLPAWSTDAKTAKATAVVLPKPMDVSATPHLDLAVRLPAPSPGQFQPGNVDHADVTVYAADGHTAHGTARIEPGSSWTPLSLDLSSWPGVHAVTRIKVSVRGTTDDDWRGTFDLDQVGFSRGVAPATDRTNLDVTATADSRHGTGSKVTLTVTDNDTRPLQGTVAVQPCDGVSLNPATFAVDGTAAGGTHTLTGTITDYRPADAAHPAICVAYRGMTLRTVIQLPPPTETVRYGFEDGTEGWQPGQNTASVAAVTGFPNGPGTPHGGSRALDATATAGDASAPKTVTVTPATPLDLSTAQSLVAWVDCYGGAPGATGYQATITAYSGTEQITGTVSVQSDRWNQVTVDLGSWPYRNRVTRIEVGFHAVGTTAAWSPHFQVDDVGTLD